MDRRFSHVSAYARTSGGRDEKKSNLGRFSLSPLRLKVTRTIYLRYPWIYFIVYALGTSTASIYITVDDRYHTKLWQDYLFETIRVQSDQYRYNVSSWLM